MINESWNLISPRYTWRHPNNSGSFKCYLPLMIFSMQKIKDINWFFPVLLLIKECKKSNESILSRDTDHQRILQSDWMRDTTGHTRPKLIVSDVAKNSKIPPDSLQEIMMVNESCNLIGQEVQVATPNQNW